MSLYSLTKLVQMLFEPLNTKKKGECQGDVFVCVYIHTYTHIYVHIHVYIHTYTRYIGIEIYGEKYVYI